MQSQDAAPWNRLPQWARRAYIALIAYLAVALLLRLVLINLMAVPTWLAAVILASVCLGVTPSVYRWVTEKSRPDEVSGQPRPDARP